MCVPPPQGRARGVVVRGRRAVAGRRGLGARRAAGGAARAPRARRARRPALRHRGGLHRLQRRLQVPPQPSAYFSPDAFYYINNILT